MWARRCAASGGSSGSGRAVQMDFSFRRSWSASTPPKSMAPSLPLPSGRASFQSDAGRSYHMAWYRSRDALLALTSLLPYRS